MMPTRIFVFAQNGKKRKNSCGRDKCLVYLCCNCVVKILSLRLIHHLRDASLRGLVPCVSIFYVELNFGEAEA